MNKYDGNNSNKVNNHRDFKTSNNATTTQETAQPRSFLADLFKEPEDSDPIEAQAARDRRFGRTPRNNNNSGSFTK